MGLTLEQQKALAIASARLRAQQGGGNEIPIENPMAVDEPAEIATSEDDWRRATLLPVAKNQRTNETRWDWPQIAVDFGSAVMLPNDVLQGKYTDPNDPNRLDLNNKELIGRALTLSAIPALGGTGAPGVGSMAAGGMSDQTRNILSRALKDSGIQPAQVGGKIAEIGPDAVFADISPRLQKIAQALATMPGAGQKTVLEKLGARAEGRNARILGEVDETLGAAPVPSQVEAGIVANKDALGPEYQAVFKGAKAVDTTQIANDLDAAVVNLRGDAQAAAKKVRGMLNITGNADTLDPNPRTLFETRNAIDGMLATEANPKAIGVLTDARKQIDGMLAQAVPGLKEVDAKYTELARQSGALKAGGTILDNGKTALRPSEVIEQMVTGANPQGLGVGPSAVPFRLSQGARAEIDRLIGTKVNDLQALKSAVMDEGDWNRAKLAAVFGQEKADKLTNIILREMKYQATEGDALAGSRTQILKAAQDEIKGAEKKPGIFENLANLRPGSAAASAADKGLGWVGDARRAGVNKQIAELLMSNDPAVAASLGYKPWAATRLAPNVGAKAELGSEDMRKRTRDLAKLLMLSQ